MLCTNVQHIFDCSIFVVVRVCLVPVRLSIACMMLHRLFVLRTVRMSMSSLLRMPFHLLFLVVVLDYHLHHHFSRLFHLFCIFLPLLSPSNTHLLNKTHIRGYEPLSIAMIWRFLSKRLANTLSKLVECLPDIAFEPFCIFFELFSVFHNASNNTWCEKTPYHY